MIKLAAIDLDGTLLNSDKSLSQSNLEAIHYAQEKGVKIVLCTGRPYLAMKQFTEQIGFNDEGEYIVTFNGSQVRRANDGTVLLNETITTKDLHKWYNETNRLNLPLTVIDSLMVYDPLAYPKGYESTYTTTAPRQRMDYNDFVMEHAFNKFVICTTEEHLHQQYSKISSDLLNNYQTVFSHPYQLEIGRRGVNKGSAVQKLSEKLNIPFSQIMTIGDQHNDLTMINIAGIGVAMGNAVDIIKENADYITSSNDDDGVAQAIYHFIK